MVYTVEVARHNPTTNEEETQQRLAACYSLLLSLAEGCGNATQDSSGLEPWAEDAPGAMRTQQES
jgi:hypothetical protein